MKALIKIASLLCLFLSAASIITAQIIPDHSGSMNSYCHIQDALIKSISCKDSITTFILNLFNPGASIALAMMMLFIFPPYLVLVLAVNLLILNGLIVCMCWAAKKRKIKRLGLLNAEFRNDV